MAFEMFDWMGAEALAEYARAEPLATGERARSAGWHQSPEVWRR
jgi:hypothetical protein